MDGRLGGKPVITPWQEDHGYAPQTNNKGRWLGGYGWSVGWLVRLLAMVMVKPAKHCPVKAAATAVCGWG